MTAERGDIHLRLRCCRASIARIGRMTPNGAAVDQMRQLMEGGVDIGRLMIVGAALLALGAAGFACSMLALRRGFASEQ